MAQSIGQFATMISLPQVKRSHNLPGAIELLRQSLGLRRERNPIMNNLRSKRIVRPEYKYGFIVTRSNQGFIAVLGKRHLVLLILVVLTCNRPTGSHCWSVRYLNRLRIHASLPHNHRRAADRRCFYV
jgi:hypothetical protein